MLKRKSRACTDFTIKNENSKFWGAKMWTQTTQVPRCREKVHSLHKILEPKINF